MRKFFKLFFTLLFALLVDNTMAQLSVGVSGGYAYNTLDAEAGYYYTVDYKSGGGYAVAIPIEYNLSQLGIEWLSVRAELSYITKNYTYERVYNSKVIDQQNYTNGYIDLPIMAKFSIKNGRLGGYLNTGAYVGYWASSKTDGYYTSCLLEGYTQITFSESVEFDSRKDNRFEAGALLGIGLEYDITDKIGCFVEVRYMYSLTDMQKDYMINQYPRYNSTMLTLAGVMYRFNNK